MLAILSGLLLVLAVAWPLSGPTYQGKSLRVWLKDFEAESPEARWRAAEAVRHMGTSAVPLLIPQLSYGRPHPEPQWRQRIRALLSRQSVIKLHPFRPSDERGQALAALDALGPNAKAAVPALEGLLRERPPDHRALLVLARIGPEAVPTLTRALTNEEKVIRLGARSCLEMMRSHSEVLFPKTPQDAEFMRRTCQFNLTLLQGAYREYQSQHPEQFLADGIDSRPPPRLPPGFVPPRVPTTNSRPAALHRPAAGFQ
jgi:hypothetical protein